ncbi:hypothetical protein HJG60_008868 [Phyllostomus discolor]|uniref:Uncharacterized protein n=1 Tax=Phyllostomus discolor TaxID=89673 RepID=A0A833YWH7_9CHIR|nr:hypothetical protein HJG60_008868 [Phyllostomus discolor]
MHPVTARFLIQQDARGCHGGRTWTDTDAVTPLGSMSMTGEYSALCHTRTHLLATAQFSSVGSGWGVGSRVPGAAWRYWLLPWCASGKVGGGEGSPGEGRCSDLLCPQFPKRDGCRVPFAVMRLPCSVCDPLLPTNLPASGASLRPQRPCPQAGSVEVAKSVLFHLVLRSRTVLFALLPHPSPDLALPSRLSLLLAPVSPQQHAALPPQPPCAPLGAPQRAPYPLRCPRTPL